MDPSYPLVPVANFVAFLLIIASSFTSARRSWNTGVHLLAFWAALECVIRAVNSIIWAKTSANVAPIWCDISTRIDVGASVGVAACSLVITRRLFLISRMQQNSSNCRNKRLEVAMDLSLCIGIPILVMILYFVVQVSRFQVFEEFGCATLEAASVLSLLLVNMWSVLLPMISAIFYCPRIILGFYRQRKEIKEFSPTVSADRVNYTRIMILGCADAFITLPLNTAGFIIIAFQNHLDFWDGWTGTHANFEIIPQTSSDVWKSFTMTYISIRWSEWIFVGISILLFALFGLTSDARHGYNRVFWIVMNFFGLKQPVKHDLSAVAFEQGLDNSALDTSQLRSSSDNPFRTRSLTEDLESGRLAESAETMHAEDIQ